jgi:hypothetical protein
MKFSFSALRLVTFSDIGAVEGGDGDHTDLTDVVEIVGSDG